MHLMSKSDFIHEEERKSKESCTIVTANGSITTTEKRPSASKIYLDMLIAVQ